MVAAYLPNDVLLEIFKYLPVKVLCRLKCVCRDWRQLILSPEFIELHRAQTVENLTGIRIAFNMESLIYTLKFNHDGFPCCKQLKIPPELENVVVKLVGSCDGLLCLYNRGRGFVIWNPSTRTHFQYNMFHMEVPSSMTYWYWSFGFSQRAMDYRVTWIEVPDFFEEERYIWTCSIRNGMWRRVGEFPYSIVGKEQRGIVVEGKSHWVVEGKKSKRKYVVAFDMETEEYSIVPQARHRHNSFEMQLLELDGSLCIFYMYEDAVADTRDCELWLMENYGRQNSWKKVATFLSSENRYRELMPVAFSAKKNELLCLWNGYAFAWYNLRAGAFEYVPTIALQELSGAPLLYIPTLQHD